MDQTSSHTRLWNIWPVWKGDNSTAQTQYTKMIERTFVANYQEHFHDSSSRPGFPKYRYLWSWSPPSIVWPSAEQGAACNWKFNDRLLEFCTILARVHLVSLIFSLLREVSKKIVTFSASSWRTESDNFDLTRSIKAPQTPPKLPSKLFGKGPLCLRTTSATLVTMWSPSSRKTWIWNSFLNLQHVFGVLDDSETL